MQLLQATIDLSDRRFNLGVEVFMTTDSTAYAHSRRSPEMLTSI
jgi:hypothetical protein